MKLNYLFIDNIVFTINDLSPWSHLTFVDLYCYFTYFIFLYHPTLNWVCKDLVFLSLLNVSLFLKFIE